MYKRQYLFILIVVMPIIELWLIFSVGHLIGFPLTILFILLTAVAGVALLRLQGVSTLFRARQKMAEGQMPAHEMAEGLMLAFAGALMLTPGFVTDTVGFLLLIPQIRRLLIHQFKDRINVGMSSSMGGGFAHYSPDSQFKNGGDDIIEGEFRNESGSQDSENDRLQ